MRVFYKMYNYIFNFKRLNLNINQIYFNKINIFYIINRIREGVGKSYSGGGVVVPVVLKLGLG